MFSETRFTKHCKWAVGGFHFKRSRNAWRFKNRRPLWWFPTSLLRSNRTHEAITSDAETALSIARVACRPSASIPRRFYFVGPIQFRGLRPFDGAFCFTRRLCQAVASPRTCVSNSEVRVGNESSVSRREGRLLLRQRTFPCANRDGQPAL